VAGRVSRGALISALGLLVMFGSRPAVAAAHPLDEYLQAMYVMLAADGVTLELDLTPGVLVAPQVVALIDTDGDGAISEGEGQAYAHAMLGDVLLEVDQQRDALTVTKMELPPMLTLRAGAGTIRLEAAATAESGGSPIPLGPGSHQVFVRNTHEPVKSAYQATAVLERAGEIEVAQQRRDELQHSLQVDYSVTSLARPDPVPVDGSGAWSLGRPIEQLRWLVDTLYQPTRSPALLLIALVLSALLGGLHALTPGHGKTLLASYLVGSRGTVPHAIFLGGAVTFTHTASVMATGLIVLWAGHLIVTNLLVPTLELGSGLLVVLLGVRLVRARWRSLRHGLEHGHPHEPAHPAPEHADQTHPYPHPTEAVRWRDLVTMGVSGGMTPCPEAIGILLVAIGLNRVALGMGLIVAFSLGLAAVLSLIGLLLVRSRGLVDHLGALGQHTQQLLPLGSAIIVTMLGTVMSAKAVLAYLS
jgi:ABC-type nickel/cobalt efflux system permease component RcnA